MAAAATLAPFGVDGALRSDGILRVEVHRHAELDVRALGGPPEGVLRIVEVEDAIARDESGRPVLDRKGKTMPMEDGCGPP